MITLLTVLVFGLVGSIILFILMSIGFLIVERTPVSEIPKELMRLLD